MFPFNKRPGFFIHSFQMLKWAGDGGGGGFGTVCTYFDTVRPLICISVFCGDRFRRASRFCSGRTVAPLILFVYSVQFPAIKAFSCIEIN
jgi:hypothetical protein